MAKANSWQESASPENKYSYGQYVFYAVFLGIVLAGLIALFIWYLFAPATEKTHLVYVYSQPTGDMRGIPFQLEDQKAIAKRLGDQKKVVKFDDLQNFVNDFKSEISNNVDIKSDATLILYLSAFGDVRTDEDGISRSVIKTAQDSSFSVEEILKVIQETSSAANTVLVLDVGHDYAGPQNYSSSQFEFDRNPFVEQLSKDIASFESDSNKTVWVITTCDTGELPLYSINQRRTLFSLALEDALSEDKGNVQDLFDSLRHYCMDNSGQAAQTPVLFSTPSGIKNADNPPMVIRSVFNKQDTEATNDAGETAEPPTTIQQAARTVENGKTISTLWSQRDELLTPDGLYPVNYEPAAWNELNDSLSLLCLEDRTLESLRAETRSRFDNALRTLRTTGRNNMDRILESFPGLKKSGEADSSPNDKTEIALAFCKFQELKFKARQYVALLDQLSWLLSDAQLREFRQQTSALLEVLNQQSYLFETNSGGLDDLVKYRAALKEFEKVEGFASFAFSKLIALDGTVLGPLNGHTREMVLDYLLQSPLFTQQHEKEYSGSLPDRASIANQLVAFPTSTAVNKIARIKPDRRQQIYQQLTELWNMNSEPERNSRPYTLANYYDFPNPSMVVGLSISEKTIPISVAIDRISGGKTIDPENRYFEGTEIDLKLKETRNRSIDLVCTLSPDAPFQFAGMSEQRELTLKNSDGKLKLIAKRIHTTDDDSSSYRMTVAVQSNGKTLDDPQNPGRPFQFDIPLRLPYPNQVQLLVDSQIEPLPTSEPALLRRRANHLEPFNMKIANLWHKKRNVRLTLFPAVDLGKNVPLMPGLVNNNVMGLTNQKRKSVDPSLGYIAFANVTLDPATSSGNVSQTIKWQTEKDPKKPELAPALPLFSGNGFKQGLLCLVEDTELGWEQEHWIQIVPDDVQKYVQITPVFEDDLDDGYDLVLEMKKLTTDNKPISLGWKLGNMTLDQDRAKIYDSNTQRIKVIGKAREQIKDGSFLFVDVDGWPRKIAFQYNGLTFKKPDGQPTASVVLKRKVKEGMDPRLPPLDPPLENHDDGISTIFGLPLDNNEGRTNRPESITAEFELNVFNERGFHFPDSSDEFEVYTGNVHRFFYPYDVQSSVNVGETGGLSLLCSVKNHTANIQITGNKFDVELKKTTVNGNERITNRKIARVYFDQTKPQIIGSPSVSKTVEAGKRGTVYLRATDSGAGIDDKTGIKYVISPMQLAEFPAEGALPADNFDGEKFSFVVPPNTKPGIQYMGVQVTDRLGNKTAKWDPAFAFTAKPKVKPVVVVPKPDEVEKPKPVTHVLILKVLIGPQSLKDNEDPTIEIKPALESPPVREGNVYTFEGLQPNQRYTISGNMEKMILGSKTKVAGNFVWKTPAVGRRRTTKTDKLILESK